MTRGTPDEKAEFAFRMLDTGGKGSLMVVVKFSNSIPLYLFMCSFWGVGFTVTTVDCCGALDARHGFKHLIDHRFFRCVVGI